MQKDIIKLPSDQDISGRDLGREELEQLTQVISSGVLNSTKGTKVAEFEKKFAEMHGAKHAVAMASGSAGVHCALAALDLSPMDEVITTPITDMGAITPIIYQGCVPVFADVDPYSYNVTAATIKRRITAKTKAIIVTHLFGNPCEMNEIMAIARERGIPVIEDCAQAFLAQYHSKIVGTIGDIGVFSMQQGKHMTTGEGGIIVTNNDDYARRVKLFVNKAWGYGDKNPDHYFLALNYRLTELQGAVAIAQLAKLSKCVSQRQKMAVRLDQKLAGIPGIKIPKPPANSTHVYWKYCLDVDQAVLGFDVSKLATELRKYEIASAPRYIQKPAFRCQVIREGKTYGSQNYPFGAASLKNYQDEAWCLKEFPGAYQALSRILVLPWNEFYTEEHVDYIADCIHQSLASLAALK
jgi:dTDP-4-amino-4,6-dideoxygalactose transaminase